MTSPVTNLESLSVVELDSLIASAELVRRQKRERRVLQFTVDGEQMFYDTQRNRLWLDPDGTRLSPFNNVVAAAFNELVMNQETCDRLSRIFNRLANRLG